MTIKHDDLSFPGGLCFFYTRCKEAAVRAVQVTFVVHLPSFPREAEGYKFRPVAGDPPPNTPGLLWGENVCLTYLKYPLYSKPRAGRVDCYPSTGTFRLPPLLT